MIFSQRDPRWANQRLGTVNDTTIGGYGCYITTFAMVATHFGKDTNPSDLDNIATDRGLYVGGNLCTDDLLSKVYPDIQFHGVYHCESIPCNMDVFNDFNVYEHEAIICIDFDHNPGNGVQTHFMRVESWNNGVLLVDDPWYGDRVNFADRYGDPTITIQKVVQYYGPSLPAPPAPEVTPVPEPTPEPETPVEIPVVVVPPTETPVEEPTLPPVEAPKEEKPVNRLKSRKLWITILGIVVAVAAAVQNAISAGQAVTVASILSAVYVAVQGLVDSNKQE